MCSAWLSCRSPPRLSRGWVRLPEEHGIGAVPGLQREGSFGAEPLVACGVADQDRGGQRAATLLGQQSRSLGADELGQLAREPLDTAVDAAQVRDLLARDPDPGAGGQLSQLPLDPVKRPRLVERFALERGLGEW
jgi:hypothetical protein